MSLMTLTLNVLWLKMYTRFTTDLLQEKRSQIISYGLKSIKVIVKWNIHKLNIFKFTTCIYCFSMYVSEVDSVGQWLQDLRCMTETECMCVLQGKSLSKDTTDVVFTTSKTTKGSFCTYLLTWNHQNVILFIFANIAPFILDHIDLIKARAQIISTEFAKLFRWVSLGSSASLVPGGTNRGPTATP